MAVPTRTTTEIRLQQLEARADETSECNRRQSEEIAALAGRISQIEADLGLEPPPERFMDEPVVREERVNLDTLEYQRNPPKSRANLP